MASLEARTKRGPWRVVWRDGGRGAKKHHSEWYARKGDASDHKVRIERQKAAAAPVRPGQLLTWAALVDRFIVSRQDATEHYRSDVRRTLERLAAKRGWSSTADVTPTTCNGLLMFHIRTLRAFLAFAVDQDQPVDPRVLRKRPPKSKPGPPDLLTDRHAKLLQRWADRQGPGPGGVIHCMLTYGHRAESLVPLRCQALAGSTLTLKVKSGDTHAHPVVPETARRLSALAKGRSPKDPLFLSHQGTEWASSRDFVAWWWHQLPRVLRLPGGRIPGILDLRRYASTRMLDLGVDLKTAAAIQGRKTAALLADVYARTTLARQSAAIDALALKMADVPPGVPNH